MIAANVQLAQALKEAKRRKGKQLIPKDERDPQSLTNEKGPRVQTNAPANEWPTDGEF